MVTLSGLTERSSLHLQSKRTKLSIGNDPSVGLHYLCVAEASWEICLIILASHSQSRGSMVVSGFGDRTPSSGSRRWQKLAAVTR